MSEWKEYKLGDWADIVMGQSPSGEFCNNNDYGIPLLNGPTEFDRKFPVPVQYTTDAKKKSKIGDILFCVRGSSTGKMNFANIEYAIGRGIAAIRHNHNLKAQNFIKSILDYNLPAILGGATGSTFPNVSGEDLRNLKILVPPIPEQIAIAEVLSSLDDKIDLLHRQNKTLEKLAETLFRQWFVEEAEEGWAYLRDFSINIRKNASITELKKHQYYVGLEHIPRKSIALDSWGDTITLASNKSIFERNDILFGKLRSYFHKVVFAPFGGVCSTDILVIRPKNENWFCFCLFWYFNSNVVEFSDLGSGGTRMPRTSWEILSSYRIPKPNLDKINKFENFVHPMIEKITENLNQIRTLTQLRDTLLPKLMSGEIRVNG